MVVRRLDSLDRREQPQRRIQRQHVDTKGRRLGIRAAATLLQGGLKFPRHSLDTGLQARPVQFAAAERPPVSKQAFLDLQTHPPNRFSGSSTIDQLLEVALEVRPADLAQFPRQLVVNRPAVATDDPGDRLAQQGLKALEIPPEMD